MSADQRRQLWSVSHSERTMESSRLLCQLLSAPNKIYRDRTKQDSLPWPSQELLRRSHSIFGQTNCWRGCSACRYSEKVFILHWLKCSLTKSGSIVWRKSNSGFASQSFQYLFVQEPCCVEISMSVLILLKSWCGPVTVSSSKRSFKLRRHNER